MKKTILVSLAISTALLLSTTAAFAAPNSDTKLEGETKQTVFTQITEPVKITGTVMEISGCEMAVKTMDGITYSVPLDEISKIDGFDDLGIIVGTEVTLKSKQLHVISFSGKVITVDEAQKLVEGSTSAVPAEGSCTVITVTTDEAQKLVEGSESAVPVEGSCTVKVITADEAQQLMEGSESTEGTYTVKIVTAEEEPKLVEVVSSIKDDTLVFIATEITANGKTVKLTK